jgi:chromosome segregation protein
VRLDGLRRERSDAGAALEAARAARDRAREEHGAATSEAERLAADLERASAERETAQEAADDARQRATALQERLQATRAELAALAEPHDARAGLGRRLADAGWSTLLDTVDAPEASWPAVEAVVGGELGGALLWADGDPTDELDDARGTARLLVTESEIDAVTRRAALDAVGGERTLAEWVGAAVAPIAFHRTAVAPSLDALLGGWRRLPPGWSAVTALGDLADARGIVVLRGRGDPPGGHAARAHARRRELTGAVAELERDASDTQREAHATAERLRAARDAHVAARDRHDEAERRTRRARGDLDAGEAQVTRLDERIGRLERDLALLAESAPSAEAEATRTTSDELTALETAAASARARRDELARTRDEARERWATARSAAEAAETRTAGQRRERSLREARVAQLTAGLPGRERQHGALDGERTALADEVAAARTADAEAAKRQADADQARATRRSELIELERGHGDASARLGELERGAQATAIEASRRDEALAALARERELALEGLPETSVEAPADEIEALDDEALEVEMRRVRRTLAQIGSVNPFAVDEHRELSTRLEEMSAQEGDLRGAIASTEELIGRLDEEIAQQFDTAFRAIAERFDEYCRLLFAGGSGSLQMADEADGDAPGGIEIVVRPPGKRLQRLAMLSGGERALTGVALLFAMLTVNPVPFCILDEVDAALDEANIGRFADALRKLSESIDFVVITHNRATIEVADTIYGVTMTDAAVSRVLSLRLADLPAEVTA